MERIQQRPLPPVPPKSRAGIGTPAGSFRDPGRPLKPVPGDGKQAANGGSIYDDSIIMTSDPETVAYAKTNPPLKPFTSTPTSEMFDHQGSKQIPPDNSVIHKPSSRKLFSPTAKVCGVRDQQLNSPNQDTAAPKIVSPATAYHDNSFVIKFRTSLFHSKYKECAIKPVVRSIPSRNSQKVSDKNTSASSRFSAASTVKEPHSGVSGSDWTVTKQSRNTAKMSAPTGARLDPTTNRRAGSPSILHSNGSATLGSRQRLSRKGSSVKRRGSKRQRRGSSHQHEQL
jgi:hypothetical protein